MTVNFWVSFLFVLVVACPAMGQVAAKAHVTEKDYHLWGELFTDQISDKGSWASFRMHYKGRADTLFLSKTDGKKMLAFPGAAMGTFGGERYFATLDKDEVLHVTELARGTVRRLPGIKSYAFLSGGQQLAAIGTGGLDIYGLKGAVALHLDGVENMVASPKHDALLASGTTNGKPFVSLVELSGTPSATVVYSDSEGKIPVMAWQRSGGSFAFFEKAAAEGVNVFWYSRGLKKLHRLEPVTVTGFPKQWHIRDWHELAVSDDGERVIFLLRKDAAAAEKFDGVQQWNGNDAIPYPYFALGADLEYNGRIASWSPAANRFSCINDAQMSQIMLNATYDYALVWSRTDLPQQYTITPEVNYYVVSLKTGEKSPMVRKQSSNVLENSLSPGGKYFAYARDRDWWIYEFASRKHTNLTRGRGLDLWNSEENAPHGAMRELAGWGPADSYLLVYDRHDLWKFPLDGKAPQRLTKGKERGTSYTVVQPIEHEFQRSNFRGIIAPPIDLHAPVALYGKIGNAKGCFMLMPDGTVNTLDSGQSLNSYAVKAAAAPVVGYLSESWSQPRQYRVAGVKARKPRTLYRSNPQHGRYLWGRQEMVSYKNKAGEVLQGILFYPAGFDPAKKYPMVVSIYEIQSYMQHEYDNPSVYGREAFNLAHLTVNGYFVLLPDIVYKMGDPGPSATDCVVAAVKAVLGKGSVDPARVGLMGHSFGGYETNFIATQTNIFACVVTGASIADLPGYYLAIGWDTGHPEIWRAENQQWRMKKSLFADREGYARNSPLTHVDKIAAPVLIWTGGKDYQVHYFESIKLYLALQRLGKKVILFLYPGEGHSLQKNNNRRDLSQRVDDWFGYYLKGEEPAAWIIKGIE